MAPNIPNTEAELVAAIEYHNRRYWEIGEPEISDEDYDALLRKLESLNPDHPLLQKVLAPAVASTGKVKLDKPMLSLDKVYYFKEEDIPPEEKKKNKKSLMKWLSEIKRSDDEVFLIQPKLDGISANFANNVLSTRGDGIIGENITDKLPLIELETKGHKGKPDRPVRGEIVIRDDDFKTLYPHIKRKDGKTYKNSRNAVAGIMGLKEIGDILAQGAKLTFVDYNLVSYSVTFAEFAEKWPEILKEVEELPYPMDGLVIKLADEAYGESLGNTAHHPRGQIAFKFSGVRRKTRLLDVMWSFGKNCLTPVAQLEPVEIGGITIKQATLHNVKNLIDKDIQIGDMVIVERAGDVIPYIVSREEGGKRRSPIIAECPCCKSKLITDGPELRCTNPECTETKVQRILAAVRNIGIERLGEPNIRKMMNTLGVKTLKDIFELKIEDILKLEGFKEKSAENLYNNIQLAKQTSDYQLIASLNISGIGSVIAKKILSEYALTELRGMSCDELSFIPDIGTERAKIIQAKLLEKSTEIDDLISSIQISRCKKDDIPRPIICLYVEKYHKGKELNYFRNKANEYGFNIQKPYEQDFPEGIDILVSETTEEGKDDIKSKARKLGAKILTLNDFNKYFLDSKNLHNIKIHIHSSISKEKRSLLEKSILAKNGNIVIYKKINIPALFQILVISDDDSKDNLIADKAHKTHAMIIFEKDFESYLASKYKVKIEQFSKKKICFTGKMPEHKSFYENIADKSGYESVNAVSKSLDLLVAADLNTKSSKTEKAKALGIEIIQLNDWLKQINFSPIDRSPNKGKEIQQTFDF